MLETCVGGVATLSLVAHASTVGSTSISFQIIGSGRVPRENFLLAMSPVAVRIIEGEGDDSRDRDAERKREALRVS